MQRVNARLSQRIAQEAQLLAEEKWIIDALRKVKQQRNSLQIERLHLENLRATVDNKDLRNQIISAPSIGNTVVTAQVESLPPPPPPPEEPVPPIQTEAPPEDNTIPTTLSQFDVPVAGIDDEMCNNEKLNLSVTGSVFSHQQFNVFDTEEDEEDLENALEDEEDMENTLIDMNMLMQSKPS